MMQVNMFEAKTNLSKLIKMLETKQEDVIYLARNGIAVAQMTLIPKGQGLKRIGVAEGKFKVPEMFDEWDKGGFYGTYSRNRDSRFRKIDAEELFLCR